MDAVTKLTLSISKPGLTAFEKLDMIGHTIKACIARADRVSMWLFDEQQNKIFSIYSLDEKNQISAGLELHKNDFSPYFDYILSNQVLNASDARNHPVTECFNELYFEPTNIYSLLDFIFQLDFKPAGVICCERTSTATRWTDSDERNLQRISRVTSMFLASSVIEPGFSQAQILERVSR